ncbi:MAG: hypothetical protein QM627_09545 [Luteolibacter sp.]
MLEICLVMLVATCCAAAGVVWLMPSSAQERKTVTDEAIRLVEQARASALASRKPVVMAIESPGDFSDVSCYRLGIFSVEDRSDAGDDVLRVKQIRRWLEVPERIVIAAGASDDLPNVMDAPKRIIRYGSEHAPRETVVRLLEFSEEGGLKSPPGEGPVILRIAERKGGTGSAASEREERLKIGRVNARAYRF